MCSGSVSGSGSHHHKKHHHHHSSGAASASGSSNQQPPSGALSASGTYGQPPLQQPVQNLVGQQPSFALSMAGTFNSGQPSYGSSAGGYGGYGGGPFAGYGSASPLSGTASSQPQNYAMSMTFQYS